jgi:hypothetical protein
MPIDNRDDVSGAIYPERYDEKRNFGGKVLPSTWYIKHGTARYPPVFCRNVSSPEPVIFSLGQACQVDGIIGRIEHPAGDIAPVRPEHELAIVSPRPVPLFFLFTLPKVKTPADIALVFEEDHMQVGGG